MSASQADISKSMDQLPQCQAAFRNTRASLFALEDGLVTTKAYKTNAVVADQINKWIKSAIVRAVISAKQLDDGDILFIIGALKDIHEMPFTEE